MKGFFFVDFQGYDDDSIIYMFTWCYFGVDGLRLRPETTIVFRNIEPVTGITPTD